MVPPPTQREREREEHRYLKEKKQFTSLPGWVAICARVPMKADTFVVTWNIFSISLLLYH